jgi:hypothetical protein
MATGKLVDLRTGQPDADNPACGATWGKPRVVRAEVLAELLTQQGQEPRRSRALRLAGARITGTLDLEGAELVCPLLLSGCWFEEPVRLVEAQAVTVRLPGCHLPALDAEELTTRGNLELDEGFTAEGGVNLVGAHIGGILDLSGASLTNAGRLALNADGITVEQFLLGRGLNAQGEVRLLGGHVKGQITLRNATLTNPEGLTLNAQGLTVDQGLYGRQLTSRGVASLASAHVRELDWEAASLVNPGGTALDARGLTVDHSMLCAQGFTAEGEVNLLGADIGGALELNGATLANSGGSALNADSVRVELYVSAEGFTAEGEVSLVGADIGGMLRFDGATLTNPSRRALSADRLTVTQDMLCREGFTAEGEVSLIGAHIGGTLGFDGATSLTNPSGRALNLESTHVGVLFLRPATKPNGVDLTQAKIGVLYDDQTTWPEKLHLVGFSYDALHEPQTVSAKKRLGWLRLDPDGYSPQPYEQLATVYRRAGREEDARRVAIAKQQQRRHGLSWPARLWSWLLGALVGHGYRTWLAGIWLIGFLVAGTILFAVAHANHLLTEAKLPRELQHFNPLVYALDVLLPIVNLGQEGSWVPHQWAAVCYWVLTLAGWVLTTAVVAALTGLVKRE